MVIRIRQSFWSSLLGSEIKKIIPSHLRLRARIFLLAAVFLSLLLSPAGTAFADSATWNLNPGNGDWNSATNWMPPTIPNGDSDIATFEVSNITGVANTARTTVAEIVFQPGASAFSIRIGRLLLINQAISNNSGLTQNFVLPELGLLMEPLAFINTATAGSATTFTVEGENHVGCTFCIGGLIQFGDSSSADNATFICNGGTRFNAGGGTIQFFDTSSAGNATFTNNGARSAAARGGSVTFFGRSTASNGTFINKGASAIGSGSQPGGTTLFVNISHAANATLIARGQSGGPPGAIQFTADSKGGMARVAVSGTGNLNISTHEPPGVVVGSIEGNGMIFLGANNLTVGSNNRDTTFSGVIQDGDINPGGGTGGSLTKVRTGRLILGNANTYTGGTTIKRGILMVNNIGGSGTGSGPVAVNDGRLGGVGTIAGAVTVGSGSGLEAVLSPGYQHSINPGTLTIQNSLTFNSDATYEVEVNSSSATADEVIANGATINNGAQFSFADVGSTVLPPGTVFTVIDNTAATPIAGTLSNLPDGSMFTVNGNTYQANYEGRDGNDLTLTVIP